MKIKKPSKRTTLNVIAALILLLVIFLAFLTWHDHHKHQQLEASMTAVYSNLNKVGATSLKKHDICSRTVEIYGDGNRYCTIEIDAKVTESKSNSMVEKYVAAIKRTNGFDLISEGGHVGSDRIYNAVKVNRQCNLISDYHFVRFYCDDTAWYQKFWN